jgi:hypothetical protein
MRMTKQYIVLTVKLMLEKIIIIMMVNANASSKNKNVDCKKTISLFAYEIMIMKCL